MNNATGRSAAGSSSKRKFRSKLERRKIAEEALVPGASVSKVAKAHGARPNQVRHWRRLYCQGLLDEAAAISLVPVSIADQLDEEAAGGTGITSAAAKFPLPQAPVRGTIRIETRRGKISVEGAAEPACLRVVLEYLLG